MDYDAVLQQLKTLNELTAAVIKALENGDSEEANRVAKTRNRTLKSIDFQSLKNSSTALPNEVNSALNLFISMNNDLTATATELRERLQEEISKVRKGRTMDKAYQGKS